jgi:predicted aspartyl protease
MTFQLIREISSNLFLVNITIDNLYELKMLLDTGATHTTIDSNALYLLGYNLSESIGTVEIETANGIVDTDVFEIANFSALGIVKDNYQIQVYDFLAHSIFSDYNGLLGMDFWESTTFCINTINATISVDIPTINT